MARIMTSSQASSNAGLSNAPPVEDPPVPPKVREALRGSANFGEFRAKRRFLFVHLFAAKEMCWARQLRQQRQLKDWS